MQGKFENNISLPAIIANKGETLLLAFFACSRNSFLRLQTDERKLFSL
ncbi:hypothetical protein DB29_01381 [Shouchella clausii]|nr:hypothetical protein DB29_01381 [Shouchella clausii]